MKKLLLLAGFAALTAMPALAQTPSWTYAKPFPDTTSAPNTYRTTSFSQPHGVAVTPDGNVWIQPYNASAGVTIQTVSGAKAVHAIYIFTPSGQPASFSPLFAVTMPDGSRDTLGGSTAPNATGVNTFTNRSGGRGLAVDGDGNVIVTVGNYVYRVNGATAAGMNKVLATTFGVAAGLAGSAVDRAGRVFVTSVVPGDPIVMLNKDFSFRENVVNADVGFSRISLTSVTGDTVYSLPYDKARILRYIRPDEFAGFGAADTLLRGMKSETAGRQPVTNYVWFSGGSKNDKPDSTKFSRNVWYGFVEKDLGTATSRQQARDSIQWGDIATTSGRPRGIAFSPDGRTAYLIQFSSEAYAVERFTKNGPLGTASDEEQWLPAGLELSRIAPNPVSGRTRISYALHQTGDVRLAVYDMLGREVAVLVEGSRAAGDNEVVFDASALTPGAYFVRLQAGVYTLSRRITVAR